MVAEVKVRFGKNLAIRIKFGVKLMIIVKNKMIKNHNNQIRETILFIEIWGKNIL